MSRDWNAALYLRFQEYRTRPAQDLAGAVSVPNPARILDLGCGPGNSTQVLRGRFPSARILGVDNSENMLRTAREACPDCRFLLCDASGEDLLTAGRDFDLIFSNACLQWLPNHAALLKRLRQMLRPGGMLAVQIPVNTQEPIHRILMDTAEREEWNRHFSMPQGVFYTETAETYADLLAESFSGYEIWQTDYYHRLSAPDEIMEWYRSTGLRPYLNALNEQEGAEFERQVFEQVKKAYPRQKNGEVLFRFPRLFFTATA